MAVNKVVINTEKGAQTLIDISDSTVASNKMLKGTVAYGANGEKVNGTIETVATAPLFMSSSLYDGAIVINAETSQEEGYVMGGGYQESRMIYLSVDGNTATVTDRTVSFSKKVADIIGNVDTSKNIILSGDLADGAYTVLFQGKDGLITVGSLPIGVTYTNQLTIATDNSGNVYNNGLGYINGYKVTSYSGTSALSGLTEASGFFTSGFIPYTNAQAQERVPFYLKGIELDLSADNRFALVHPNAASNWYGSSTFNGDATTIKVTKLADKYYMLKPDTSVYNKNAWNTVTANGIKGTTHIRFSFKGSGAGVILTVNEPIE